jgi:CheY-like chemotaxis protein
MTAQPTRDEVVFLLAEENDGYAELTQTHLREAGVRNPFLRFKTGEAVLDFLLKAGGDPQRKGGRNFLLLLDVQLPQGDGVQVWQRLKAEPALQDLPVIMLTTTDDPREITRGCRLGLQAL